jgi:hypothetical protein
MIRGPAGCANAPGGVATSIIMTSATAMIEQEGNFIAMLRNVIEFA